MEKTTTSSSSNSGNGTATSPQTPQERRFPTRGFASMSPARQREIASQGGRAAHAKGTAHEWSADEARTAGSKGGRNSHGGRGSQQDEKGNWVPTRTAA